MILEKNIKTKINSNNKLSPIQKTSLIQEYLNGEKTTILSDRYKITPCSVLGILKRRDVKIEKRTTRKVFFNVNFFDNVDSEIKAYLLGFLYADGCNHTNKKTRNHRISLEICDKDIEIINLFVEHLQIKDPHLFFRKRRIKILNNKKHSIVRSCSLNLSGEIFCKKMSEKGMIQRKSLTLKFSNEDQVPNHLIRHFIRGYMDGDGSVTSNRWKNIYLHFISTKRFCKKISENIFKFTNIKPNYYKRGNVWVIVLGGNKQVIKVLDWLYSDAKFFLARKRKRFIDFLHHYKNKDFKMDNCSTQPIDRQAMFSKYL